MEKKEFNRDVILRYLTGDATEAEMHQLKEWLDEKNTNRREFLSVKKTFTETTAHLSKKNDKSEQAFNIFLQKVEKLPPKQFALNEQKNGSAVFKLLRYAAAIILLISVGVGGYYIGNGPKVDNTCNEIIVPYGSKTNVILPDGTKLWLNAGSKLRYSNAFNSSRREVFLEGEGYFEVKKKNIPFIVHTSHFDIRVMGTTFNVKSYADEEIIVTTLVEGSIAVETGNNTKPLFLKPNQKLIFSKTKANTRIDSVVSELNDSQNKSPEEKLPEAKDLKSLSPFTTGFIENDVDVEKSISWKEGTLIFDRESLEDLATKLERKFDITIKFENTKLKAYSFTGTVKDFPLEQVLEALKLTAKINYKIKGKVVKLY